MSISRAKGLKNQIRGIRNTIVVKSYLILPLHSANNEMVRTNLS